MKIDLLVNGKPVPLHRHEGTTYAEAPTKGEYVIRIKNDSPYRRMTVVSVDGVSVLDGSDAGHDGPGYVLRPWETLDIPGWRRDEGKVAAFKFGKASGSYAAKTGRGTDNAGVIGVAVFDEKAKPLTQYIKEIHHHHRDRWPWWRPYYGPIWLNSQSTLHSEPATLSVDVTCNASSDVSTYSVCSTEPTKSADVLRSTKSSANFDLGTGYGKEQAFHTHDVEFERASSSPALVASLRYATRARLVEWGVPVDKAKPAAPNPFPMSKGTGVPAPAGWNGK